MEQELGKLLACRLLFVFQEDVNQLASPSDKGQKGSTQVNTSDLQASGLTEL